MTPYSGNCPRNVARDAKYSVRWVDGTTKVSLVYRHENGERWLASTDEHPKLIDVVNRVKLEVTDQDRGPFYINEFRQVLVPAGKHGAYYLAGEYAGRLEFEFQSVARDGEISTAILSGDARALNGDRLSPGDTWEGPHPGIPYILTAKNDICYEVVPRPNVTKRILLSECAGAARAREVAQQVVRIKGGSGRFYVNEFAQMFAPVGASLPVEYVYIGGLDLVAGWFPKVA